MNANTKVSEQCRIAAFKTDQVLGMIRRNIIYYIYVIQSLHAGTLPLTPPRASHGMLRKLL